MDATSLKSEPISDGRLPPSLKNTLPGVLGTHKTLCYLDAVRSAITAEMPEKLLIYEILNFDV